MATSQSTAKTDGRIGFDDDSTLENTPSATLRVVHLPPIAANIIGHRLVYRASLHWVSSSEVCPLVWPIAVYSYLSIRDRKIGSLCEKHEIFP